MRHELKTWPGYFQAVKSGEKTFEVRSEDDRVFTVGDILHLREWVPRTKSYTGESIERVVTYVLRDAWEFGVLRGYVVLGLAAEIRQHARREGGEG